MAMQLTLTNLFQFFSTLSPLLLGFFIICATILNQNIKGFIWLAGVLIAFILNSLLMNIIRSPISPNRSPLCSIIEMPFGLQQFNSPAFNSMFITFTLAYMLLPMIYSGYMNYGVIVGLFAILAMDAVSKLSNNCTTPLGVLLGALFGFLLGGVWYGLIKASGNPQLLYFEETSDNQVCSRPSKQTFKCAVYKGGKLIKNL